MNNTSLSIYNTSLSNIRLGGLPVYSGTEACQVDITRTPAYIFGKIVVRPALDGVVSLCKPIGTAVQIAYSLFINSSNIFSGAQASPVCSAPSDEGNHFDIPILGKMTHSELLEKFENLGALGSGGDAVIFKVREKGSGKTYAISY